MSSAKMISALLLLTSCFNLSVQVQVQEEVKVSIYYGTYCPDCRDFILNELVPTFEKIGYCLNIDFVPYGKAITEGKNGKYTFQCEHGPKECIGNMGHACVMHLSKSQELDIPYINCTLKTGQPGRLDVMAKCASKADVAFSAIKQCMDSDLGGELLAKFGQRTLATPLTTVPFVIYNDHFNQTLNDMALKDFFKTTCSLFKTKPVSYSFFPFYN